MTYALREAGAFYKAGRMEEAAEVCRRLVETDPGDAEAWHQLGLTEAALGRMPQALQHLEQAVALRPDAAVFHANLGLALGMSEDWTRAADAYRQAVEIRPDHAASLAKLGRALVRIGALQEGILRLDEAVAIEAAPDHANALGAALAQADRLAEAVKWLRRALADDPAHDEARANLVQVGERALRRGTVHAERLEWAEALADFEVSLDALPERAEPHYHAGLAATALSKLGRACHCYARATQIRPGYAEAWNNWAHVELALGRGEWALELAQRAATERPGYADAHYNTGVILQDLDRPDEAAACYQRVLDLEPDRADAWNNLGSLALGRNHWPQAIENFDQALAIQPRHIDARWNRALTLLTLGCWDAGWPQYEVRLEREEYRSRSFAARRWEGEDLNGRSILVWAEQGLGDTLQFLRLVPQLNQRGARVFVECQPRLQALLAGSGIDAISRGETLPDTDFEVPLMSLPARLALESDSIPPPLAYTVPAHRVQEWRERLAGVGLKVGLVWGAQVANFAGRSRSMGLTLAKRLSEVPGVRLISVQHGPQREEAFDCPWLEVFDEPQGDLLDTAALIANLDLLITVDTMTAHLAGSLGRPVWTLLPFAADWRWMQTSQTQPASRTAWYPSMRLFRQSRRGDWPSVVEEVRRVLALRANVLSKP